MEANRAKISKVDRWHKNSIFSIFFHSDHIFAIAQKFPHVMDQKGHTSKKCLKAVQRRAEGSNLTFSQKKRWKWPKMAIFWTYSWENQFFFTESNLAQKVWIVRACSINSNYWIESYCRFRKAKNVKKIYLFSTHPSTIWLIIFQN